MYSCKTHHETFDLFVLNIIPFILQSFFYISCNVVISILTLTTLKGGDYFLFFCPPHNELTIVSIPSFQRHLGPSDGNWGLSPG